MFKKWWNGQTPFLRWVIRSLIILVLFTVFIILVMPRRTPTPTKVTVIVSAVVLSGALGLGGRKAFGTTSSREDTLDDENEDVSGEILPAMHSAAPDRTAHRRYNSPDMPDEPTGEAPYMPAILDYWSVLSLPGDDFTVIDVETTGLDPETNDFVELGAIRYRRRKPVEEYHTYVRPLGRISSEAEAKHHITWEDVEDAPSFREVFSDFLDF